MKSERAPLKNPGKNGRFENTGANKEAQNLVSQWEQQQGKEAPKPLPWTGIFFGLAVLGGIAYWLKH